MRSPEAGRGAVRPFRPLVTAGGNIGASRGASGARGTVDTATPTPLTWRDVVSISPLQHFYGSTRLVIRELNPAVHKKGTVPKQLNRLGEHWRWMRGPLYPFVQLLATADRPWQQNKIAGASAALVLVAGRDFGDA